MIPARFFILLSIGGMFAIVKANESLDKVSTTTVRPEFLSSFDRIITRMESTRDRIAKILNETRQNDIKSYHDLFIGKGYQYTTDVGYHKLIIRKLSWYDAMQYCRMEDAHLAIIDSSTEAVVLSKLVKEKLTDISGEKSVAYVGYHDYCANAWIDVFFKPIGNNNYIHWKESTISTGPKCAAIEGNGYLRSSPCSASQAFICETKSPYSSKSSSN